MAKNINQIYAANPITSLPANALLYVGDSGVDAAIQVMNTGLANLTPQRLLLGASDGHITQVAGLSYDSATGILTTNNQPLIIQGALATQGEIKFFGAFTGHFTLTAGTDVTFPTTGTLATTAQLGSYLQIANNLSDVASVATSRTNLGLGTGNSPTFTGLTLSGLTSGSLLFAGTSGAISQNNSQLFWDNTNTALGIGTNTPTSGIPSKVKINNAGSTLRTGLYITGAISGTSSGSPRGIHVDINFSPSIGSTLIGIDSDVNFAAPAATSLTSICYQASPSFSGNLGTITSYGYFYDGGVSPDGTVDFAWGAFLSNPNMGSTAKMALYAANFMVGSGYSVTTPPTDGGCIKGQLALGTSSATSSALLTMVSTTKGFLPPSMTTTQKNTISSPAAGLVVYDNVLLDIFFYNGSTWIGSSTSGVTTLTGTANQVLVNGTSGSAQSGALTLTLPQSIGTSSSPTFAGLTLTAFSGVVKAAAGVLSASTITNSDLASGSFTNITGVGTLTAGTWNATVIAGQYGGTGVANTGLTINLGSGGTGKVMVSDSSGNATWSTFTSFGVSTLTGTASQVLVNGTSGTPTSGAITLTLPQSIATSSNVQFAKVGIGGVPTNALDVTGATTITGLTVIGGTSFSSLTRLTLSANAADRYAFVLNGTLNADDGNATIGIYNNVTLSPTNNNKSVYGAVFFANATPVSTNTITLATAADFQLIGSVGSGAITTSYSGRFFNPSVGTTKVAVYAENMLIGFSGIAPPTNGLQVQGISSFGTSSYISDTALPVQLNATSSNLQRYFAINKDGAYAALIGFENGSSFGTGLNIRCVTTDPILFYVNNTVNAGRILSTGEYLINMSTGSTTAPLSVTGFSGGGIANFYNSTSNAGIVRIQTSNASGINGAVLALNHTRGTIASPTATQVNDLLGIIDFGGYTNALYNPGAVIFGVAAETWSSTAAGTDIWFYTTPKTTISNIETLRLTSQGSVVCGGNNGAALATNATDGFIYIPSSAGAPTGVPTSFTGRVAMQYDTTNNKLYVYNSAWKSVTLT